MMKKLVALAVAAALLVPASAEASLLAGFDTFDADPSAANFVDTGITASLTHAGTRFSNGRGASNDGTFGSFAGPPTAAQTFGFVGAALAYANGTSGTITISITNNSAADLNLGTLEFDGLGFRNNGSRDYALSVLAGSGISVGSVAGGSGTITAIGTTAAAVGQSATGTDLHEEVVISLTGLADSTLAIGESASFALDFSGGVVGSGGNDVLIDNIGITSAAAIPEPSSLALLGICSAGIVARRRRK